MHIIIKKKVCSKHWNYVRYSTFMQFYQTKTFKKKKRDICLGVNNALVSSSPNVSFYKIDSMLIDV